LEENQANPKHIIVYNIKIKRNTPYLILLLEVGLSPITSKAMIRCLIYKLKIINIKDKMLLNTVSNSSETHSRLKR